MPLHRVATQQRQVPNSRWSQLLLALSVPVARFTSTSAVALENKG
jgi:hypothetical protein